MKKKYIWALVFGIFILIVPTAIYLGFLIPKLSERYNILMASAGTIGGGAFYGATLIPEKLKYGKLLKTAVNSYTLMCLIWIVQDFLPQILGCIAVFVTSFIIFRVLLGVYRDGRRKQENTELATEVARSITEAIK